MSKLRSGERVIVTHPTWPYETIMGATFHGWQMRYGETYALVKYDGRPVDKLRRVPIERARPARIQPWWRRWARRFVQWRR